MLSTIARIQQKDDRHEVHAVRADLCQSGAVHTVGTKWSDGLGDEAASLNPTRVMSNAMPMLRKLQAVCRDSHKHQPLLGGRAAHAAFYPLPLSKAILEGMAATVQKEKSVTGMREAEYDVSLNMSLVAAATESPDKPAQEMVGEIPKQSGGSVRTVYDMNNVKASYLDEYTREPIPHELARDAIISFYFAF